jgi:hypothetical protein
VEYSLQLCTDRCLFYADITGGYSTAVISKVRVRYRSDDRSARMSADPEGANLGGGLML